MDVILLSLIAPIAGWGGALLAARRKSARIAVVLAILALMAYSAFAVLLAFVDSFRRNFSYDIQFWTLRDVRYTALAASGFTAGWIFYECRRKKRRDYLVVGIILAMLVPAVFVRKFTIAYDSIPNDSSRGTWILQSTNFTCTAASLGNLCTQAGISLSERQAAELMHLDQFGGSVPQLGYALQKLGFPFVETQGEKIGAVAFPAILIVDYHGIPNFHAILVLGPNGDQFAAVDPLVGKTTFDEAWFAQNWRGKGIMNIHR
jgi:hypothetical protein